MSSRFFRPGALGLTLALAGATSGLAQGQAPISAIDWLDRPDPMAALRTAPAEPVIEPPVSRNAQVPHVEVLPLDSVQLGAVGLLPQSFTGLPQDLWLGSDPDQVAALLRRLDVDRLPAMQSLLYTLMLAESEPPASEGETPVLLLARLDKLRDMGAVEPALSLLERAGPEHHPELFARNFDLALLAGTEDQACARMTARPDLAPGYDARIYCLARTGDWRAAALTFSTVRALGTLPATTETLLELFLEPALIEGMPPMAPPARITPLTFRLFEAIGQPLPSAAQPRAFAMTDLRGVSGWKAELEAVERLARTGALSENRLLGLYTARKPAASGGIWDRVAAIQDFDAAIRKGAPQEIADSITAAWAAMREAGLEVPFARLFGERLSKIELPGRPAQRTAFRTAMLSPDYELSARRMKPEGAEELFLASLAQGAPDVSQAQSATARAVAAAFAPDATPPEDTAALIRQDRLGEAILQAMLLYSRAAHGEWKDATEALVILRSVGLEDTARRAALQMLILDRRV